MTDRARQDAVDPDQTPPHGTIDQDEWRLGGSNPTDTKVFTRTRVLWFVAFVGAALIAVYVLNLVNPE